MAGLVEPHSLGEGIPLLEICFGFECPHIPFHFVIVAGVRERKLLHRVIDAPFFVLVLVEVGGVGEAGDASKCRIEDAAGVVGDHDVGGHEEPLHVLVVRNIQDIGVRGLVVFGQGPQDGVEADGDSPLSSEALRQDALEPG